MRCISLGAGGIASIYAEVLGGMPEFSVMVADQRHGAAEAQPTILSGAQPIGAAEKALAGGRRSLPPSRLDLFSRGHHVLLDCNGHNERGLNMSGCGLRSSYPVMLAQAGSHVCRLLRRHRLLKEAWAPTFVG